MKSGLEDRNNDPNGPPASLGATHVSMKSGLEDRNNYAADMREAVLSFESQ